MHIIFFLTGLAALGATRISCEVLPHSNSTLTSAVVHNVATSQQQNQTVSLPQEIRGEQTGSNLSTAATFDAVDQSSRNASSGLVKVSTRMNIASPSGDLADGGATDINTQVISNSGNHPDSGNVVPDGFLSDVGDAELEEITSGGVSPHFERQQRQSKSDSLVATEHRLHKPDSSHPDHRVSPDSPLKDPTHDTSADDYLAEPGIEYPNYEYYDDAGVQSSLDETQPGFYATLSLHKCHCDAQEIWTNSSCSLHNGTFVAVLNRSFRPVAVNTSWFGEIDIHPLTCEKGYTKSLFKGGSFNLMLSIDLLHAFSNAIFTPKHFCVDHILDAKNQLSWQAEVCVPPPSVPRCCPDGEKIYSLNRHCVSDPTIKFNPPVMLQDTNFSTIDGPVTTVKCSEDKDILWVELGKQSSLDYTGEGTLIMFQPEGSARIVESAPNYCVAAERHSETEDTVYWASFCYRDKLKEHMERCANGTCVRKCCDKNQLFDVSKNGCAVPDEGFQLWQPTFHNLNKSNHAVEVQRPKDLVFVYGKPLCKDFFALEPSKALDDKFFILENGSLHVPVWDKPVNATSYCVDHFLVDSSVSREHAMVCFPETVAAKTTCQRVSGVVYPSLLIVSCVFLAITLGVYAAVPELHAKVHGKSLVSHVTALLVSYVGLVVVQWGSNQLPMRACIVMAAVIHISFLATFFWLNVMCFDIYWTLRSLRPIPESGEGSRSRFKWYSIYAWGCPLVVGAVTIAMLQLNPEQHPNLILPGFGVKNCWFSEQAALWLYFYGFVLALTLINIFFFLQVAHILFQAQRATRTILRTTTRQEKDRMRLYVKLFVVMGVTWICEVISWQEGTCEVWVITDIINSLQGFFIFLIFVCKRNVFQKLRLKCDPGISRVKRIVRTSSSYVNTSQMSQRTTQITLDSIRRSSMTHPPSAVKLSNGSHCSGMHVIHEDAPAVDELSHSRATEHEFVNGGGVSSPPSYSSTSSPVFIVGPPPHLSGVDPEKPPTFVLESNRARDADFRVKPDTQGDRSFDPASNRNGATGVHGHHPVTVDVTVHGNVRQQ